MKTREGCLPLISVMIAGGIASAFLDPFLALHGQTGWVRFIAIFALFLGTPLILSYLWKPKKLKPKDQDES